MQRLLRTILAILLLTTTLSAAHAGTYFEAADSLQGGISADPTAVHLSTDGRFVYWGGDPFAVQGGLMTARLEGDGTWTIVQTLEEIDGVALSTDLDLASSADGRFLYVLLSNQLMVMAVDPVDGTLGFVERHSGEFSQATDVRRGMLAGWLYVGAFDRIVSYRLDPATGKLSDGEGLTDVGFRSFEVSSDGQYLIAAGNPAIRLYSLRNGRPNRVSSLDDVQIGNHLLNAAYLVSSTRDSGEFYVAGVGTGDPFGSYFVAVLRIIAGDQLSVAAGTTGIGGEQEVTGFGLIGDDILVRAMIGTNGSENWLDVYSLLPSGELGEQIASFFHPFHPGGLQAMWPVPGSNQVLVGSFAGMPLGRLELDGEEATLTSIAQPVMAPTALAIARQEGAYYAGLDGDVPVSRFERSGLGLGAAAPIPVNVAGVLDLEVSSDGSRIVVLTSSGTLHSLRRDDEGVYSLVDSVFDGENLRALVASPDFAFVYGDAGQGWSVGDTELTPLAAPTTTSGAEALRGLPGSPGSTQLRISPDGRRLYHLANNEEASFFTATLFWRDPATGLLTEAESEVFADALDHAVDVGFSPDGRHVYVLRAIPGSETDQLRLDAFRWNAQTQRHVAVSQHAEAALSQPGIAQAPELAVDPNGRFLFFTGTTQGAVAVYDRDPETGRLIYRETLTLPAGSVTADERQLNLAVGPTGELLVAIHRLGRVDLFRRTCVAGDLRTLCLGNGGRFLAEVDWGVSTGLDGFGRQVAGAPASDSGLMYFFSANNWEVLIKVLDGCALNERFWVFAAGTTDVGYGLRVSDRLTGVGVAYRQPNGQIIPAITDTDALATCLPESTVAESYAQSEWTPPLIARPASATAAEVLELGDFDVRLTWTTPGGEKGPGQVVPFQSADSGLFAFFSPNNWEALVKVLDGCAINGRYWLFAAAPTNVGFELAITRGATIKTWGNPPGPPAPAIIDTDAFPCN
jgi:6-phosphogluconolactonase (cycloisomerase 2 family)